MCVNYFSYPFSDVSVISEVHKYVEMVCVNSRDSFLTGNLHSSVEKAGASQAEKGF